MTHFVISVLAEFVSEALVCYFSCLGEAVHVPPYFEMDVSTFGMVVEIVFLFDVHRQNCRFHSRIIIPVHWRAKVKVFNIDAHILRSGALRTLLHKILDVLHLAVSIVMSPG